MLLGPLACAAPSPPATGGPAAARAADGAAPASAPQAAAEPTAAAAAAPPIRVRYAYTAIAGSMAPMWVAYDLGLYAKYGVEPELTYAPSTQTIQAVLSGDTDFGLMSVRTLVEAHVAGADATGVAVLTNKVVQSLFGAPQITSIADLRDKRVGITRFGSIVANSARMLLRTGGLTPGRTTSCCSSSGASPRSSAGLQGGATEGGLLSPPFTLAARKLGYRELARMQDLPFEYANVVLVSRRSYVEANAEATRRTMRAMAEASAIFQRDRDTSLKVLAAYLRTDDADVLAETYQLNAEGPRALPADHARGRGVGNRRGRRRELAAQRLRPGDVIDGRWADELLRDGFLARLERSLRSTARRAPAPLSPSSGRDTPRASGVPWRLRACYVRTTLA